MKFKSIYLSIVIIILYSCNNDDDIATFNSQIPDDVYVAGHKNNIATYWKNNVEIPLNSTANQSTANKIVVSNGNVYVMGKVFSPLMSYYSKWVNGVETNLNTTFQETNYIVDKITDMHIVGNDEYFLGYLKSTNPPVTYDLVYWKNGVKNIIKQNCIFIESGSSIKIVNNNVYVFSRNENNQKGVYINNIFNPVGTGYLAYNMITDNNDVYIYGYYNGGGFYRNVITGNEITTSNNITGLNFDNSNGNIYFKERYDDGNVFSSRRAIRKNNSNYEYISPAGYESHIPDFKLMNGDLYIIVRELTNANHGSNKLLKNNQEEIVLDNILYDDSLKSIFIIDN